MFDIDLGFNRKQNKKQTDKNKCANRFYLMQFLKFYNINYFQANLSFKITLLL